MWKHPFHKQELSHLSFLVTGGAGFIGSHIVEYLMKYGAGEVKVMDNLLTGFEENISPYLEDSNFEFLKADLRNKEKCLEACKTVDIVFHQAALGSVPRSIENPALTNEINVTGTLNILLAAKEAKVQRMVMASSSSVYGDDHSLPKKEAQVGRPLSPYAVSKRTGEHNGLVFRDLFDMEIIMLRYFNVFGPRQDPEGPYAAVIPKFIQAFLNDDPITVHGDGEQTRDFTFVENVVQANIKAALVDRAQVSEQCIFNVAVGENYSINQLYRGLQKITGAEPVVKRTEPREGDVRDSLADISAIRKCLGYKPGIKLEKGLAHTVAFFQESLSTKA